MLSTQAVHTVFLLLHNCSGSAVDVDYNMTAALRVVRLGFFRFAAT